MLTRKDTLTCHPEESRREESGDDAAEEGLHGAVALLSPCLLAVCRYEKEDSRCAGARCVCFCVSLLRDFGLWGVVGSWAGGWLGSCDIVWGVNCCGRWYLCSLLVCIFLITVQQVYRYTNTGQQIIVMSLMSVYSIALKTVYFN